MLLPEKQQNLLDVCGEVFNEVKRAVQMFGPMHGPHEASAVILEEYDEFWDEVKAFNLNKGRDTRPAMRTELIQLAAMAIRAISDVIDQPTEASCKLKQGLDDQMLPDGQTVGNLLASRR